MRGNAEEVKIEKTEKIDEFSGKLDFNHVDEKLMHSVLENDKKTIDDGKIIRDAINQGISFFTPDIMFENLVKNYSLAEHIYGPSLLRRISGYDENYLQKNIKIPEFQRELKRSIEQRVNELKKKGLIDNEGFTEKAIELAALILYIEELDKITPKGILGEKVHKKGFLYGDRENIERYKKGLRYRDISVRKSIKTAVRRSHEQISADDLRVFERKAKGAAYIVYAIDASGSMKGKKIETAKKAGIALAFKAINERDKVGLIVFGSEVKEEIRPTRNFTLLLKEITKAKASKQTNIAETLRRAVALFPAEKITKHLIIITDAVPTVGKKPEKETLEAASLARSNGVTISLVGIQLDKEAKKLAEQMTLIGNGRLYLAKDLEEIDKIVLEDYSSLL